MFVLKDQGSISAKSFCLGFGELSSVLDLLKPFIFNCYDLKIDVWPTHHLIDFKTVVGFVLQGLFFKFTIEPEYPTQQ